MPSREARFDLRFYRAESVTEAIEAFSAFGEFTAEAGNEAVTVSAEIKRDTPRVWGEFLNYVLVGSWEAPQ